MGEWLIPFGEATGNLGIKLMPFSFIGYIIMAFITYKWNLRYYLKLLKSIWYVANILMYIDGDVYAETLALMILTFEAIDSFCDYLEERKKRKI